LSLTKERGVSLRATEQPINTGTAPGKAFLDNICLQTETTLRKERQAEGIAAAKARGHTSAGRQRSMP
jgi:DNA invertase Pin-like site-specific DNA recombinase